MEEEQYSITFVDTENVSQKVITRLITYLDYGLKGIKNIGVWCYSLNDNRSTQSLAWKEEVYQLKGYHWKEIKTDRKHNAVDMEIARDVEKLIANPQNDRITNYILVSADGDYYDVIRKVQQKGKRVTVIGTSNISGRVKAVCNEYIEAKYE